LLRLLSHLANAFAHRIGQFTAPGLIADILEPVHQFLARLLSGARCKEQANAYADKNPSKASHNILLFGVCPHA